MKNKIMQAIILIGTLVVAGCTSVKGTGGSSTYGNGGDGIRGDTSQSPNAEVNPNIKVHP